MVLLSHASNIIPVGPEDRKLETCRTRAIGNDPTKARRQRGCGGEASDNRSKKHAEGDDAANRLLTVREACRLLYVHSNTLRRWSDRGIVRVYRVGPRGDRRFRAGDIAVLLAEPNLYPRAKPR